MTGGTERQQVSRYLIVAAALVVIFAGVRAASSLILPFLLAAFFAMVLTPALRWLQRKGIPTPGALLVMIGAAVLAGVLVFAILGSTIASLRKELPQYRDRLVAQTDLIEKWTETQRVKWQELLMGRHEKPPEERAGASEQGAGDEPTPVSQMFDSLLDPDSAIGLLQGLLSQLSTLLGNTMIILLTVIFTLLEASRLPAKLNAISGPTGTALARAEEIVSKVRQYLAIKTTTSLLTGILVGILTLTLGFKYAIIWALLAFLFNYIPNIGSILAAIPAVLFAAVDLGLGWAAGAACGYVMINVFVSYAIEPRMMGKGLGLSTLVVFLSLVFWGWLLGPVGMLLSAPLTMIVKIVLEGDDETRWIAILLSSKAPELSKGQNP